MVPELDLAFRLADLADEQTMRRWSASGVATTIKTDGTAVTDGDIAAEAAVLEAVRRECPLDGFLGEEVGSHPSSSKRRWIVDGIDGTVFYAAGASTWGTLIALEDDGEIVLGIASSPAQGRRWWASKGGGTFTAPLADPLDRRRLQVAGPRRLRQDLVVTLPSYHSFDYARRRAIERIARGAPTDRPWSHQIKVASGEVDVCVWMAGDIWDHAAPSILVEEAGGVFSDLHGGRRLDTRTALYSNGHHHDRILAALGSQNLS